MALDLFFYAIIGGLIPSFVWLYFILQESADHPEPRSLIRLAFVVGMLVVPLAIFFEQSIVGDTVNNLTLSTLALWATIEEVLKYAVAAVFILWRPVMTEDIDYVIYMITVSLGFAAVENTLFLFSTLIEQGIVSGILTGDMRFIGSTLLHVTASAIVGFFLAFSDKSSVPIRIAAGLSGVILAIVLHTAFNALIMMEGATSVTAVFLVWFIAVIIFAAFEVLKYFSAEQQTSNYPQQL